MEEWEVIEDFPGFAISDHGRVEDLDKERLVPTRQNREGFEMVTVHDNLKQYTRSVAIFVAKAFLEPPCNEAYNSIIHLNGDRSDCRAQNIMWRPRWFALKYHKMFDDTPFRVMVYIPSLDRVFGSLREFCTTYGLIELDAYHDMFNQRPCYHYGWVIERYQE